MKTKMATLFCLFGGILYANISGVVFRDLPVNGTKENVYGVKDANELGIKDIEVSAYNESGEKVDTTLTKLDGSFELKTTSGKYRVEFNKWPSFLKESFSGNVNNSSVRFVDDGSSVNFALHNPADFSESNPKVIIPITYNGDPTKGGTTGGAQAIKLFSYDGSNQMSNVALNKDVGAIWGMAYGKKSKTLYAASVLKRHIGFGPMGIDGIYKVDLNNTSAPVVTQWLSLNSLDGVDVGSNPRSESLPANLGESNNDPEAFVEAGKIGIGDIDLSDDEKKLYVVNLNNHGELLTIDTATKKLDKKTAIPSDLCTEPDDVRPWGVTYHDGNVYVGVVCSGEKGGASSLSFSVLKYDGSAFSTILSGPLTYKKGKVHGNYDFPADWETWANEWSEIHSMGSIRGVGTRKARPQPILSDIEFDAKGNMILGFVDRAGLQLGYKNRATTGTTADNNGYIGGDILKAEYDYAQDAYTLENGGKTSNGEGCGANNEGPGGGEFFCGENYGDTHRETSLGNLAILKGSNLVTLGVMDPKDIWTNGVAWLDDSTGKSKRSYQIYKTKDGDGTMGKADGLGDIELISAPAPIEIGNFVWYDANGNGIQDAGEEPLANIKLTLHQGKDCKAAAIGEATTDSQGEYYFGGVTNANLNSSVSLESNSEYTICIELAQEALGGKKLTKDSAADDKIDSDGINDGNGNAYTTVTTKDIGDNDHTYDFGFYETSCLGNFVWNDKNVNGIQDVGEEGVGGVTVKLNKDGTEINTTKTNDKGYYEFCDLEEGDYKVIFDLKTLPAHFKVTIKDANTTDDTKDSDADPTSGESSVVTINKGDNNDTIDMGIYRLPCLGDYVWEDSDKNGIQDNNETPIDKVKVELLDESGANVLQTTETNASGYYEFCDLEANSKYQVKFTTPKEYKPTLANVGDDRKDSDSVNSIAPASIASDDNLTIDAGFYKPACLGDRVWYDKNKNGIQDSDESGVSDVVVTLYIDNKESNTTTKTDKDGKYQFCDLEPGVYSVKFDKPEKYEAFTKKDAGDDNNDSDADDSGKTDSVTLKSGDDYKDLDAGLTKPPTSIDLEKYTQAQDKEFYQADSIDDNDVPTLIEAHKVVWKYVIVNDGGKDLEDVKLIDSKEGVISNCVDEDNKSVTLPAKLASGASLTCLKEGIVQNASKGDYENNATVVGVDEDDSNATDSDLSHYKVIAPACISNLIWEDKNANGIQDDGESGISGAKVELFDSNGNSVVDADDKNVTAQITKDNGEYEFCNLLPGDYHIKVTPPEGYVISPKDSGDDDKKDSDIDPSTGESEDTTLESGEKDPTWDGGVFKPACISNLIWEDKNANGIQDANEKGVANAVVELLDNSGSSVKDINSSSVTPITTKDDGEYEFCNLVPGEYHIKVTPPEGYVISPKDVGSDDSKDSDIDPNTGESNTTTLESGESDPTWDGGVFKPACLGNYTWLDENVNGLQDVNEKILSEVEATLLDKDGNKVIKGANGKDIINPLLTDAKGNYHFCNLIPGEYKVVFKKEPDSSGSPYITTAKNSSDDKLNSDVEEFKDAKDGVVTPSVVLQSGDDNNDTDAGFIQEICLGDYVWEDKNANGVQEDDEEPIANVGVKLLMRDDNNSWIDAKDVKGNSIDKIKTNKDGEYKFCHLKPAVDYKIVFDKPEPKDGLEYIVTTKDTNSNKSDSKDSDIDENREIVVLKPVVNDYTLDAGFFREACIGNRVWLDSNANGIQDENEVNIANAKVTLYNEDGVTIAKRLDGSEAVVETNSSDSNYHICHLRPAKYIVSVTKPDGVNYYFTKASSDKDSNFDTNKDNDSNVNPELSKAENGKTVTVELSSGEDDITWDAGMFEPACLGDYIWEDSNVNGVQDKDEVGVANIALELYKDGKAVTKDIDNKEFIAKTDENGSYEFCQLIPGEYEVKVTVPKGYFVTRKDTTNDSKDSDMGEFLDTQKQVSMPKEVLVSAENNQTLDGGLFKSACLGDYTFKDENANGIQDEADTPLAKVTATIVPLKDKYGNINKKDVFNKELGNKLTDKKGYYEFCNLIPGDYKVSFQKAEDENGAPYLSTAQNVDDDAKDSDIPSFKIATNGGLDTSKETLESGEFNKTLDAGFIQEICLGDYVWEDKNANGVQEDDEIPLKDVGVSLKMRDKNGKWVDAKDVKGNPIKKTKTNNIGGYSFCHLRPAVDYKIVFDKPEPKDGLEYYVTAKDKGNDAKDSDIDENREIVVIKPVVDNYTLDAGFFRPACIGDYIWEDRDANGIQDENESSLKDVKVELLSLDGSSDIIDVNGNKVEPQITKEDGIYHFCNLRPNFYHVKVTAPDGYYVTRANQGDDDSKDSDITPTFNAKEGTTPNTELVSGEDDRSWDAGVFRPACIGNQIWEDSNANGIFEAVVEHGVRDVEITLTSLEDSSSNINATDLEGNELPRVIKTDVRGQYKYCNLVPGKYKIDVKVPDGYLATRENTTSDNNDSDLGKFLERGILSMPEETLESGENNMTLDGGVFKPACLGDYVWLDRNVNGLQDPDETPIAGMNVKLIPVIDDYGYINDIDVDREIIKDKIIKTDENGHYEYCNLIPGTYKVAFKSDDKIYFSTKKAESVDGNSVVDEFKNAKSYWLESKEIDVSSSGMSKRMVVLDAGFIEEMCLGDKVWFDENLNGIQDKNEFGIRDITVKLLTKDGKVAQDINGNDIEPIKTDENGEYIFCHLAPAKSYKLAFDLPESYVVSKPNVDKDKKDEIDSDVKDDATVLVSKLMYVEDSKYKGLKNDKPGDYTKDVGVYCECEDYKVHPERYKEVTADAFNIAGALSAIFAMIFIFTRKEEEA